MKKVKSAREVHLYLLKQEAEGKEMFSNSPGSTQQARRILKYVLRVPENLAELEVHKNFLALCRREDSIARSLLYFWTEFLDGELKAHCLAGEMPKDKAELIGYKLDIRWTPNFGMETDGLAMLLKKQFSFEIKEFLFRAEYVDPGQVDELARKTNANARGTKTLVALAANNDNLIFFYNPALTLKQAAACLRAQKSEWIRT